MSALLFVSPLSTANAVHDMGFARLCQQYFLKKFKNMFVCVYFKQKRMFCLKYVRKESFPRERRVFQCRRIAVSSGFPAFSEKSFGWLFFMGDQT